MRTFFPGEMLPGPAKLRVLPLGGLGRIGGNLLVYETAADLVVVDCGVCFPDSGQEPGVEWLVPRIEYLLERSEKLRGYLITHGHEDHIGALPHVLAQLPAPVYATRLTLGMIRHKLAEREMEAELVEIRARERFSVGELTVEPLAVTHSIPDAVALVLETPVGVMVHSGDFKLDPDPIDGRQSDLDRLGELGAAGVVALLSDSTNAQRQGHTAGERSVAETLLRLIGDAPRRVLATTFSSNLHRLQSVIDASAAAQRRVIPVGRSCRQMIQLGREQGYLRAPHGILGEPEEAKRIDRERLTIIASGCQAENYSAFGTIARGDHGQIRLEAGDRVLLSARRIPGNEQAIGRAVNALLRHGVEVIDDHGSDRIHASGHACRDEQRHLIELCAPQFFTPIHGERRHLEAHAETARSLGVETQLIEDGQPLDLIRDGDRVRVSRGEPVEAGLECLDGTATVPPIVLRDRQVLSAVGFVSCLLVVDEDRRLIAPPQLTTRGVIYVDESGDLLERAGDEVWDALEDLAVDAPDEALEEAARLALRRFFRRELGRRPMILPALVLAD